MKNKCIIFLFCHSILLLAACTGGFENDNEIKGGFSDDKKGNRFPEPDCSIRTHTVGYLLQYRFCWLKLGMADDTIPEP